MPTPPTADRFVYDHYHLELATGLLECTYRLGDYTFTETYSFPPAELGSAAEVESRAAALDKAARLVFLLAAVSYYKAAAPPLVDLNGHDITATEAAFLHSYYRYGLGEFAVTNGLPLVDIELVGAATDVAPSPAAVSGLHPGRPLVPFGGGLDSIVTLERVRPLIDEPTLFVVSRPGDLFEAIATAASVAQAPLVNVGRQLDPTILKSRELGFLNGHVPVTGILSAVSVLAAVAGGHGAVIMSNEWSASFGNTEIDGEAVNHQYSKSHEFEGAFRSVLAESIPGLEYFSMLRSDSELRIAKEFQTLTQYHTKFRSCNRAFHLNPADRWDHWCGRCDKCAFIDLILSPFLSADQLAQVFAEEGEPLRNPAMRPVFESLIGASSAEHKPFECVGEINECRAATRLAAARPDRADPSVDGLLADLVAAIPDDPADLPAETLMGPLGDDFVPAHYRP